MRTMKPAYRLFCGALTLIAVMLCTSQISAKVEHGAIHIKSLHGTNYLGGDWLFKAEDRMEYAQPGIEDRDWMLIGNDINWSEVDGIRDYKGLGWYRLHLTIDEIGEYYIYISDADSGLELYFNGVLIRRTRPLIDNTQFQPIETKPEIFSVPASLVKKGENVLAIRAGILNGFAGFGNNSYFGEYEKTNKEFVNHLVLNISLVSILLFSSLLFFIFYINRPCEKHYAYYSALCCSLGTWIIGVTCIIYYIIDNYQVCVLLTFSGAIFATMMTINFLYSFFNQKKDIVANAFIVFLVILLVFLYVELLYTNRIENFQKFLYKPFMLSNLLINAYMLYFIIKQVLIKKPFAVGILCGVSVFTIGNIFTVLFYMKILELGDMVRGGFFGMAIVFAYILALRYSQIFTQLETAHGDLLVLDKMKDEFLANTSHELRTPLHSIMGLADAALSHEAEPLSPSLRESFLMIFESARRLSHLVDDILDFNRLQAGKVDLLLEEVRLGEVLRGIASLSKGLVGEKDIEVRCRIPDDLPSVLGDRHRIEQIVLNLIGNAVKFTDSGEVSLSAHSDDRCVTVEVRDTGVGIPSEKLSRIWNPYEQGEDSDTRRHGGSGLGLAITKRLVALHGGMIWVESEPGRGSVFRFTLPFTVPAVTPSIPLEGTAISDIRPAPPEEARQPHRTAGRGLEARDTGDSYGILIVDDDAINVKIVTDALRTAGYRTHAVSNGKEAMEYLEKETPDLIVLDIMLPGMSGYELASQIRARFKEHYLPIVMVTAKNSVEDMIKSFAFGGNDYIAKPFNARELLARVENQIVIRNFIDTEKQVESHLSEESRNAKTTLAQRSRLLQDAIHKIAEWEHIIARDLVMARRFIDTLMWRQIEQADIELELHYDPLLTIGGDVFDVYEFEPGRIRVFVGDATGHGVNAALNTITIMSEYDFLRHMELSPAEIISVLNERFCRKLLQYKILFTCTVAEIDLNSGRLRIASAGHPEQYMIDPNGALLALKPKGPIIGFQGDARFEEQSCEFASGSTLFCYSDGILDDFPPDDETGTGERRRFCSEAQLRTVIQSAAKNNEYGSICTTVKTAMKGADYRKKRFTDDDITMIALRRKLN